MWSFQRLATGTGRHDDRGRSRQQLSRELVAKASLHLQERFWCNMVAAAAASRRASSLSTVPLPSAPSLPTCLVLHTPAATTVGFLGCRVMWDEAAHKLRPLLGSKTDGSPSSATLAGGQAVSQILSMVCFLTCVCLRFAGDEYMSVQRWEPWICPLRIMSQTTTNYILQAVLSNMPFALDDPSVKETVLAACDLLI